jgi:hypothetical protein
VRFPDGAVVQVSDIKPGQRVTVDHPTVAAGK